MVALAAARARLPGAPRPVLTLHSGMCPAYLAARGERREIARAVCSSYGRVIAVSQEVAAALERCGVPPEGIAVIPAFLAAGLSPGAPPRGFAALRAARAPLFCAALGPGPVYGEDLLLEAFARARRREPRAGLVVFGRGSLDGSSARVGLSGGVLAAGELAHPQALGVVARSDVFVRPTLADGDALSVREALSLGRAVVASAVVERPPGCVLFRGGDPSALVAAMLHAARVPPTPIGRWAPVRDAFEQLLDVYRVAADGRPIPSDSSASVQAPCSSP